MANVKEQSAALKSRQTKLLKKSKEELIEVILRKDKVERNQVNQISKLKGEVNSLQSRIKGYIADNDGNEEKIKELRNDNIFLKDRNSSLNEKINAKSIEIEKLRNDYSKLEDLNKTLHENIAFSRSELEETTNQFNKIIVETELKAKSWANIAITTAIVLGIAFITVAFAYISK